MYLASKIYDTELSFILPLLWQTNIHFKRTQEKHPSYCQILWAVCVMGVFDTDFMKNHSHSSLRVSGLMHLCQLKI